MSRCRAVNEGFDITCRRSAFVFNVSMLPHAMLRHYVCYYWLFINFLFFLYFWIFGEENMLVAFPPECQLIVQFRQLSA